jgi:hypothetical protein
MTHVDESIRPPASDEPTVPSSRVVGYCLAIVSVATAIIHFAVAGEHFQQYWLFGVFMLVTAWLQLLWAIVVIAKPFRLLLWSGVLLNAGVVAVYIVTRTVGDIIGPTPNAVEPFGFGDGLCTVLEAAVVAACAWLLVAKTDRRVRRHRLFLALAATGAVAASLLSVTLVAGGPEMVMTMNAGSAAGSTSVSLATTSPAGNITMPNTSMQMAGGMKMANSAACTATPTKAQQNAAVSMVNASWAGASKYQSLSASKAAGYVPITPTGRHIVHYMNKSYYRATLLGGPVLNYADPQFLVYANTPKGAVLAAAMYMTSPGGPTPQPGGCLTQWHVHTNLCLAAAKGVVGGLHAGNSTCPAGSKNRVTPPMIHVWYIPIPGGPTAIDAPDSQVVHAAEQVAAPKNAAA